MKYDLSLFGCFCLAFKHLIKQGLIHVFVVCCGPVFSTIAFWDMLRALLLALDVLPVVGAASDIVYSLVCILWGLGCTITDLFAKECDTQGS